MLTLVFRTVAEKVPRHGQQIIYLAKGNGCFGYSSFEPKECDVEYSWVEISKDGYETGNSICWGGRPLGNYKLCIAFDGIEAEPDQLWMDFDTFSDAIRS